MLYKCPTVIMSLKKKMYVKKKHYIKCNQVSKAKVKVNDAYMYMYAYPVYYGLIDYRSGQLSDPLLRILFWLLK